MTARRKVPRAIAAIALFPALAAAQRSTPTPTPAAPAQLLAPARLTAIGDSLSPAASRTAQLAQGPGYTYAVTHRDSTGGLELHAAWSDVFVIESGSATELSGGRMLDAREASPGEWRGGRVEGATRAALHPGDVVVIPAGTPHQMLLAPGERVTYLAFKIAKP
jgi:mannose-6-phosphate isomerase-like protein (cupin superfamily)